MRDERGLDLDRRHVDAADLEHVVAAAGVHVVAVRVDRVLVAASRPRALERVARLVAVVPVPHRGGRPLDLQLAHLPGGDRAAVVADDAQVVAWHRHAARPVAHVARTIRQEDVQHLRRAEAVENLDAEVLGPPPADLRRQRLARRHAAPQRELARASAGRDWRAARRTASARRRRSSADASSGARTRRPASAARPSAPPSRRRRAER